MSKIYDALQVAYGERVGTVHNPTEVSTIPPSSLLQIESPFSASILHKESELLGLAQNIAARLPGHEKKVIQFIGSRKGEGTSTLVREFAMVSAHHSSKPVLLIEADLMQPSQYQAFGLTTAPPLDHVLKEGTTLDGVISQVEKSNLFLATLSNKVQSVLTARTFFQSTDMWKNVREHFALILIDSSPVGFTADSLALCESVDGIVLVVEAEKTRAAVAQSVKNQILMREGNLLGMVFNKRKFHIPESIYKLL